MTRSTATFGSALFFLAAPGVVAGYLPWVISGWMLGGSITARCAGVLLVGCGLVVAIDSFRRFAIEGFGTPAPVAPTIKLIVSGWYRHVRNPMYVAVLAMIFGQALLFGSPALALYGGAVWLLFHAFVVFYEEPRLKRSFGDSYIDFQRRVPRWIPLLRVRLDR
ncbi:MAG: isoprenylcysteine carboxyl methyltransferase [Acidobacteria bacterium]|nr:isoprenylcysteine carboxyl methyltransferase [Acidobacteriota bacterium]